MTRQRSPTPWAGRRRTCLVEHLLHLKYHQGHAGKRGEFNLSGFGPWLLTNLISSGYPMALNKKSPWFTSIRMFVLFWFYLFGMSQCPDSRWLVLRRIWRCLMWDSAREGSNQFVVGPCYLDNFVIFVTPHLRDPILQDRELANSPL